MPLTVNQSAEKHEDYVVGNTSTHGDVVLLRKKAYEALLKRIEDLEHQFAHHQHGSSGRSQPYWDD